MDIKKQAWPALLCTLLGGLLCWSLSVATETRPSSPEAALQSPAPADTTRINPVGMLETISSSITQEIHAHRSMYEQAPEKLRHYIDAVIVPHIDFTLMAQWVIGREVWQKSSAEDQQKFIDIFRDLLISTYGKALLSYQDYSIHYQPLREQVGDKTRVQVNSEVQMAGQAPVRLSYRLHWQNNAWFVYDIVIEGVSLLKGFQAQFSEVATKGGIPAVIAAIQASRGKKG